jgi:PhnB protein
VRLVSPAGVEKDQQGGQVVKCNPYLSFNGECEAAFRFYAECFGGRIDAMVPHKGTPAEEHVPAQWRDKIMHAMLTFGDQVLMGSDTPPERYDQPKGTYVALHFDDPAEAERVFSALGAGGAIQMPLEETFWAKRFGMLVDRFGTPWMVNCSPPA